jgi:phospholipase C
MERLGRECTLSRRVLSGVALSILVGCGAQSGIFAAPDSRVWSHYRGASSPFTHVVVIIQENRTVDDLFQFLPGADTRSYGLNLQNQKVPLTPEALTAPYDVNHSHTDWKAAYNGGAMNGWNNEVCVFVPPVNCPPNPAYGYVPQNEVQPYYTMAESYTFADNLFQTNQGPSFPAHQYTVSGTSAIDGASNLKASENPPLGLGGCDSPPETTVLLINSRGRERKMTFPCFERNSILQEADAAGVTWRYYEAAVGAGLWNAADALRPIWRKKAELNADVVAPPARVLTDIANDNLAAISFVTPTAKASDHAGVTDGTGPSWVASIVNAIGESPYWNDTVILVTWDDWGGWYDHAKPQIYNSYELGFRVPLVVISPYAKPGYVSHTRYEFGSILKFIEETFGLPPLDTTDVRANDLDDCFNFGMRARRFKRIPAAYPGSYFLAQPAQNEDPDDD